MNMHLKPSREITLKEREQELSFLYETHRHDLFYITVKYHQTSKFGEFISPAEVALVCLKFILSFIKFCSLVTELWLICGF